MCLSGVGVVILRKSLKDLSVFRFMYLVNRREYSTEFIIFYVNIMLSCNVKQRVRA